MNKRAQQIQERLALADSMEKLLDGLPGQVYRCTVSQEYEYTLVFVSKGCHKVMGLTQEEILRFPTNTVELMTVEEDLASLRMTIRQAIVSRERYEHYYRLRMPSEEIRWVWDQGHGVYDDQGKCVFLEGIMMDVTEQKNRESHLRSRNRELQGGKRPDRGLGLGKLIGTGKAMLETYDLIRKAAATDTNVILYGETGVGKDLVAQTIHELSGLKGNFIPVNCGAIPEQLLESEFFGHVKGAFSGATANRAGYLAAADKGTLFLDELGELPLALQVKLLRSLETRTYTPIGSNEPRRSHFRLISATNRNLQDLIRRKQMREDFYYRVHVLTIVVPPLRARKEDIPLLAAAYAEAKGLESGLDPHLLEVLCRHDWPGNVRELQNTLERYWIFGTLDVEHSPSLNTDPQGTTDMAAGRMLQRPEPDPDSSGLSAALPEPGAEEIVAEAQGREGPCAPPALSEAKAQAEKQQILAALERNNWRKGKTAESLGITSRTLQRKLKRYGLGRYQDR